MSRPAAASTAKQQSSLPHKGAWARGPPQLPVSSDAPLRRISQHVVPIKDGVSTSRGNVPALKHAAPVNFGSINDLDQPIDDPPVPPPPLKPDPVHSFGTVPAVAPPNGKQAHDPPAKLGRADVSKLFQTPSAVSDSASTPDAAPSPAPRPVPLPPPNQPSFPPFVTPRSQPPTQPPRSPVYPRQTPNGAPPRAPPGPTAGPAPLSAVPSPRLAPHSHTHPQPPAPPPQMQPQHGWPYYYPDQGYYMHPYPPWPMSQIQMPQHPPPPTGPHPPPISGMPLSPRTQPSALPPGTPTQAHAVPAHHPHPPSHAPSSSISNITSPPPTPSTANRLNPTSSAFVPSGRAKITFKNDEGVEVDVNALAKSSSTITASPAHRSAASVSLAARQSTPVPRRSTSVRLETQEQHQKRIEDKVRAEAEEKQRQKERREREEEQERNRLEAERSKKEQEEREKEKERLRLEEEQRAKERLRKQKEERERAEEEARARAAAEAEERRLREDRERKEREDRERKEREDRERKEREDRERKEREDRERQEQEDRERKEREDRERQEREQVEKDRLEAEEKERQRLEAEAAAEEEKAASAQEPPPVEDGEIEDTGAAQEVTGLDESPERSKSPLRIVTTLSSPDLGKKRPDPLDLSVAKKGTVPVALPSALLTARVIEDLGSVPYPEGIQSPKPELNLNAEKGKFRYDREFLLQFMKICTEKPVHMPPLDAIGLEPLGGEQSGHHTISRGGSGRHGRNPSGALPPSRQASIGLGISSGLNKFGQSQFGAMGSFTSSTSKLSSEERFLASTRAVSASGATLPFGRPSPMQRTASQGGPGGVPMSSNRTRSKRGEKRSEKGGVQQQQGGGFGQGSSNISMTSEPLIPLAVSAHRWDRKVMAATDPDSPEIVDRKVKSLLNKLTMEKFDSISDQIILWANKSEKEKDGRTLIQVIRLVFEKATDEATWSEMYARLCRKMMERISPQVQDDGIRNPEGKPITGGQLFRKYLLNRCQEDFERGWVAKEATAAAAASKAVEDEAVKAANEKEKDKDKEGGGGETVLYSDEYYAAQKAKRQGLGLIKFIGELFKLQMLTERIMHECVKKLLGNVNNPEEEEIESLCKLLTTVGVILDTQKARAHMDVYFSRMKELTKSLNVSARMQFMLQDVLELRERKWMSRNAISAPTTIAQIHENAVKEKIAQEKEAYQRQASMSRGGSRRGGTRDDFSQQSADGWAVAGNGAARAPSKAGDLSHFGKIAKPTAMTFGPSSVFAGKEGKRASISRTNSSSNMFSMLQSAEPPAEAAKPAEPLAQRRKIILQPRSKPTLDDQAQEAAAAKSESDNEDEAEGGEEDEEAAPVEMTEDQAKTKIAEDLKEFFAVRNLDEAEVYFSALPVVHHFRLVDKLASAAVEQKESDAQLVAELFGRAVSKDLVALEALEEGLMPIAEIIEDIAIDAPKAYTFFGTIVKAVGFDSAALGRLADKSTDPERLLSMLS